MSKRFRALLLISVVAAGCAPPPQLIPVPPPGLQTKRVPPPSPDGGAQALGEQPAAAAGAAAAVTSTAKTPPTPVGKEVTTKSGLKVTTLKEGTGPEVQPGQRLKVTYVGTLPDGKQFDANTTGFDVRIGTSDVIKGWDEGVPGMKVGERRRLIIPPELGYGTRNSGSIPANSTLHFDIEVLAIQ